MLTAPRACSSEVRVSRQAEVPLVLRHQNNDNEVLLSISLNNKVSPTIGRRVVKPFSYVVLLVIIDVPLNPSLLLSLLEKIRMSQSRSFSMLPVGT